MRQPDKTAPAGAKEAHRPKPDSKKDRLAKALRQNLLRRKAAKPSK